MMPHDPSGTILPHGQICEMVAGAGYDGMAIDLGPVMSLRLVVRPHMERNGLTPLIVAFPKSIESLVREHFDHMEIGAPSVDIIGQVMPLSVDGMIPVIRKWSTWRMKVGIPVQFETHRNCITNDLYATLCLIDAVPEIRLCADLIHFVVDRGFKLPLDSRDQSLIQRIIERSDSFEGRVASRQADSTAAGFPTTCQMG